MANEENKRLVVDVMARVDKLEKGMAKAAGTVSGRSAQMEARTKQFAVSMEGSITTAVTKVNGALSKLGLGGLAGAGLAGVVAGVGQIARGVAEVGDEARRAGVSFRAFQQLRHVAEQNRIGVDSLTDGLKELNLRADEFIATGSGSASEAFQRLGYGAEELKEKLKDPSDLFAEIIGRLGQFDKAAQIRIADEVFGGTGGEKFVQLIDKGEAGIRAQVQAAEDLGLVMNDSVLAKAEEIDKQFTAITTTVGTHLKAAIVSVAGELSEFIDSFNKLEDQRKRTLTSRQADLGLKRLDLENEKMKISAGESGNIFYRNPDGPMAKGRIHEIELELARIAAEEAKIVKELSKRVSEVNRSTSTFTPVQTGGSTPFRGKGFLDLIGHAEGTDKGRGYNETLGYGKFTGGDRNLVLMTLDEIDAMQTAMLRDPANTHNSSAVGRYQIVQKTMRGLRGQMGLSGSDYFTAGMQDRMAEQLMRGRGNNPAELRNEWEGLRNVDDATIRANYDSSSLSMPGMDAGMADKAEKAKELATSYDELVLKAREFVAEQGMEQEAFGMTETAAARLRYETELLNEARQAGIDLSPGQTAALKQLANDMAEAEARTHSLKDANEAARDAAESFGENAGGVMKGFIQDLARGKSGAEALKGALARIGDMMLDSALSLLFGGGGTKGGGVFGAVIGGLLPGRERGGPVSAGKPYIVGEKRPEVFVPNTAGRIIPRVEAPRLQPRRGAQQITHETALTVHIQGANGDDHVRTLVRQGVGEALANQNEQMRRGGFGHMQANYGSDKG